MNKQRWIIALLGVTLLVWSCDSNDDKDEATQVTSSDINSEGQYFSFDVGDFVESYDVSFTSQTDPFPAYIVKLNAAAGVYAYIDTAGTFDTATKPAGGFETDSTASPLIGYSWYTYDPVTHAIPTNGDVYFVRCSDGTWAKMALDAASDGAFSFRYAIEQADDSFGATQTVTDLSATDAPAYFDISAGTSGTPVDWHMGLVTIPVYDPGSGATFYMPSVLVNYENSTQVGVITDQDFEDVSSVPAGITWLEETAETRSIGYGAALEVLTYHPEPPYNHQVIVENADYVYIVDTGDGDYYKVQFLEYDSGVALLQYMAL